MGSHQGVDMVAAAGTPVYASYAGEVVVAERRGDRGNVVVLRHEWNNQILHTTYAHLSLITVRVGAKVEEGEKLGEVGDTGNATAPHLHFQIETNQDGNHPFFPRGCQGTIDEIVNEGNCYDQVRNTTLDPISFLEVATKLGDAITDKPRGSIYIQGREIQLSGFMGGFMEIERVEQIRFSKEAKS